MGGGEGEVGEFVVVPLQIDGDGAAGAEAAGVAGFPGGGECGEEFDFAVVGLKEHFGDGGAGAVVAVDLEWRVIVEKIRQGALGEEGLQVGVGLVAIEEA